MVFSVLGIQTFETSAVQDCANASNFGPCHTESIVYHQPSDRLSRIAAKDSAFLFINGKAFVLSDVTYACHQISNSILGDGVA